MPDRLIEENGRYALDCHNALWATDQIHTTYQQAKVRLKDVDFVLETEELLILVEYKNANIEGAVNPDAFQPNTEKRVDDIWRKYFDSLHYLALKGKTKPKHYVYILEYPNGDSTARRRLRTRIEDDLPFSLHTVLGIEPEIISEFSVLSIQEWNDHEVYGKFPLVPIAT
ncbi:hypothetical protein H9X86_08555 [Pseudoflavonifractor capillosus]|uniref:hypothetical protein n=1 Tax=Pseudoflavonifractor capillosus TaxID=106588 RepID=UPI001958EC2F|nr:hypothetical protein [Pseudoflavonifractor capillosus]MBM6897413.1 hypothetical protein [Pseudoflavonifractor capillosus]